MSQQNETMICGNCHKSVPAGSFCSKCGAKQTASVKEPSYEDAGVHNTPIQSTDSGTEQNSSKFSVCESSRSSGKDGSFTRRMSPSSLHGPEVVSAQEINVRRSTYSAPVTSFTIQMKPESDSFQNGRDGNIQSGSSVSTLAGYAMNCDDSGNVRKGVNDVMNATEKLNKERADKEANKVGNEYNSSANLVYQLFAMQY